MRHVNSLMLTSVLTIASMTAQAGWMDALNTVGQIAGAVQNGRQTGTDPYTTASEAYKQAEASKAMQYAQAAQAEANGTMANPPSYYANMDCAALEINALQSQRELDVIKANVKDLDAVLADPQYQQQKNMGSTIGALGSLLAQRGGKSAQFAQVAQQMGANSTAADSKMDTQLALAKKYMSDLESIKVYQKYKCAAPAAQQVVPTAAKRR